jgi:hypothetical protein
MLFVFRFLLLMQLHAASVTIDTQQVLISLGIEDRFVIHVYTCREAKALPSTHAHAHTTWYKIRV